jgi:nucleoside-diphosphate-sugar epimerase
MKRCLITGGGGFIGSHLAAYLLQNGLTVYGMVHSDVKHPENLAGDFHILECDILDKSRVEDFHPAVLAGCRANLYGKCPRHAQSSGSYKKHRY